MKTGFEAVRPVRLRLVIVGVFVIARVPFPLVVDMRPFVVRLERREIFCVVLTVMVLVVRVRPVEKVSGFS